MWKTLSSKIFHTNKWFSIAENDFEMPDKTRGKYFFVVKKGSSMVVPLKGDKVIMGKQYRYLINRWSIELPCGGMNNKSSYLRTAKEELEEETGYKAKSMKVIGEFAPYNGVSNEICRVYLATGLSHIGKKLENTEQIKNLEIEIKKVYQMIDNREIIDGMTLAALSIARRKLLNIIK